MNSVPVKERFTDFVFRLQDEICEKLEKVDGKGRFQEDTWKRKGGGGGRTRVLTNGHVFEKGGVNISTVFGELPESVQQHFQVLNKWFYATGISLVIHPLNPMIPTVHANFRFFELYHDKEMQSPADQWFGGGTDLTPYYLWEEDVVHFHQTLKNVCDIHGDTFYSQFKKECDEYFYIKHRQESRGVGGLFFDYLREDDARSVEDWYQFTTDAGHRFLDAYLPIVHRRMDESFDKKHRYWQEIRRGRYVEFNLVYDRGTLFGLKTDGRIESILMSLPPNVRWDYDYQPVPGTRESALLKVLKSPVDWIQYGKEKGFIS